MALKKHSNWLFCSHHILQKRGIFFFLSWLTQITKKRKERGIFSFLKKEVISELFTYCSTYVKKKKKPNQPVYESLGRLVDYSTWNKRKIEEIKREKEDGEGGHAHACGWRVGRSSRYCCCLCKTLDQVTKEQSLLLLVQDAGMGLLLLLLGTLLLLFLLFFSSLFPFVVALRKGDRLKPNFGETLSKGVLHKTTFKLSISVVKVLKKSSDLFLSDRGDFGWNLSERPEIGIGIF